MHNSEFLGEMTFDQSKFQDQKGGVAQQSSSQLKNQKDQLMAEPQLTDTQGLEQTLYLDARESEDTQINEPDLLSSQYQPEPLVNDALGDQNQQPDFMNSYRYQPQVPQKDQQSDAEVPVREQKRCQYPQFEDSENEEPNKKSLSQEKQNLSQNESKELPQISIHDQIEDSYDGNNKKFFNDSKKSSGSSQSQNTVSSNKYKQQDSLSQESIQSELEESNNIADMIKQHRDSKREAELYRGVVSEDKNISGEEGGREGSGSSSKQSIDSEEVPAGQAFHLQGRPALYPKLSEIERSNDQLNSPQMERKDSGLFVSELGSRRFREFQDFQQQQNVSQNNEPANFEDSFKRTPKRDFGSPNNDYLNSSSSKFGGISVASSHYVKGDELPSSNEKEVEKIQKEKQNYVINNNNEQLVLDRKEELFKPALYPKFDDDEDENDDSNIELPKQKQKNEDHGFEDVVAEDDDVHIEHDVEDDDEEEEEEEEQKVDLKKEGVRLQQQQLPPQDLLDSRAFNETGDIYEGGSRNLMKENVPEELANNFGDGNNQSRIEFHQDVIDDDILYMPDGQINVPSESDLDQLSQTQFGFSVTITETQAMTEKFEIKDGDRENSYRVHRRYSDFDWLFTILTSRYSGYVIPTIPPKNPLTKVNQQSNEFLEERRKGLIRFLNKCLNHVYLSQLNELKAFLTYGNREDFEIYKADENEIEQYRNEKETSKSATIFQNLKSYVQSFTSSTPRQKDPQETNLHNYEAQMNHMYEYLQEFKTQMEELLRIGGVQTRLLHDFVRGGQALLNKKSHLRDSSHPLHKISGAKIKTINDSYANNATALLKDQIEDAIHYMDSCNQALIRRKEVLQKIYFLEDTIDEREIEYKKERDQQPNQELEQMKVDLQLQKQQSAQMTSTLIKDIERYKQLIKNTLSEALNKLFILKHNNLKDFAYHFNNNLA